MKIIKHGKKYDDGKPFRGDCKVCGCKIEVFKNEIKSQWDQRDGDYYYVECPECNSTIYFVDHRLGNLPSYDDTHGLLSRRD